MLGRTTRLFLHFSLRQGVGGDGVNLIEAPICSSTRPDQLGAR